jgi:hypothetical protein
MERKQKQLISFGIFLLIINFFVYSGIFQTERENIITGHWMCETNLGKIVQVTQSAVSECEKISYAYYYVKLYWMVYLLGLICIFKGFNAKNQLNSTNKF